MANSRKPKAHSAPGEKKTKGKNKKPEPQTVDDFQELADEHEQAGRKHRGAGFPDKSIRAFQRAVEAYDRGLQKFPSNLDLAYNKACLQLELATCPRLAVHLPISLTDAYRRALESHHYALKLDPKNADTLFNTSTALSGLAEETANKEDGNDEEATALLFEALQMLQECLDIQEKSYHESEEQCLAAQAALLRISENDEETLVQSTHTSSGEEDESGEWVTVVTPVTRDSLIDTMLAQYGILTVMSDTLSNMLGSSKDVPNYIFPRITKYMAELSPRIDSIMDADSGDRAQEVHLAQAIFSCAFLEARFRSNPPDVDASGYYKGREEAFKAISSPSFDSLLASFNTLLSFNSAMADFYPSNDEEISSMRWNALQTATRQLNEASRLENVDDEDKAKTHQLRGDCSLHLHAMRFPPLSYEDANRQASNLLRNADVYYRNAGKLSKDRDVRHVVAGREAVVQHLMNAENEQPLVNIDVVAKLAQGPPIVRQAIEDMIEDRLLPQQL